MIWHLVFYQPPTGGIRRLDYLVKKDATNRILWEQKDPVFGWKPLYMVKVRVK